MALAAAASIAVDSSRLDESDQRRQRSVEISSRLATDLLGGMGPVEALEQVAGSARAVAGAELGCIVVPDHSAGDLRVAAAARGDRNPGARGADLRGEFDGRGGDGLGSG
ncbi:MAG TPA: hypothetical protein VIY28_06075 [Pseudonocardiaceae bacterium]